MAARITIVGGGIMGAFAAYFLALRGAEPTLVERGELGGQASGRNAGGLSPLHGAGIPGPLQELAVGSLALHLQHWEQIRRLSGIDFGGRRVSRLHVAVDDDDAAALSARESLHNQTDGFSARWLAPDELRAVEPRVCADAVGGLWSEGDARVDPEPYTRAVAAAAQKLGARVHYAPAVGLERRDGRASAVLLEDGRIECDGVVIAPGPWCEGPASWLGVALPVEPLKGELLLVEPDGDPPASEITWRIVGAYPAAGGRMWLGGIEDRAGFDATPTESARARIIAAIDRLLPGLGPLRIVRHVAGLRPLTPDGLPIVGIAPGWKNVSLAVGPGRKGMLLSAAVGVATAELLTAGSTELPIGGCAPTRRGLPA